MDRETRIREIVESVQEFGGQMVDYSHAGGGMGGFVALAMLGDIKIDIEKLVERECAAETARADREAAARQEAERMVAFLEAFADPPDMATGNTVRDELRAERDRLRADLAALRG